jgi:GNAT superfamily N-acetyltransferase
MLHIEQRPGGCGRLCADILASLPEWFGMAESNAGYARVAEAGPAWLAVARDGPVGLMLLTDHFGSAFEIHLLAVRKAMRRRGAGQALIRAAEAHARAAGARFLTVKTLSPRDPYPPYAETRAFYAAMGFSLLEELPIWDPENPAVLMAKAL